MIHRPRPIRAVVLALAALAAFALSQLHIGPPLLLMAAVPLLAGAAAYEAIPGKPL